MKRIYLAVSLLMGLLLGDGATVLGQDTLISFDDVVFTDGQDTATTSDTADTADQQQRRVAPTGENPENAPQTLWGIFIAGLIGGFAAFLMPCIYPMVPLTVSFFTKQSGTRSKGIVNALLYGLFIIVIYVALGMLVTLFFGASALNEAASSAWFNLLFFAL